MDLTNNGFHFYIVLLMILHIFSRILLYVSKIDVFQTLHQFHAFASTHFPTPINNPQYDNSCEFHNTPLHDFLAFYGILYHFSRPHTSQQNGKTEDAFVISMTFFAHWFSKPICLCPTGLRLYTLPLISLTIALPKTSLLCMKLFIAPHHLMLISAF